jgi:7,8-dihydro-6-hydroxymethylpterin-pyrophosphokinase
MALVNRFGFVIIEYRKSARKLMLAYIGLGSNLNNPKQQIRDALIALNDTQDVKVVALSSLYQSKPIDKSTLMCLTYQSTLELNPIPAL